ncbi:MAG: 6-carboxytetrahydropterin synthase [Candidatus Omnitrophota bacterium]
MFKVAKMIYFNYGHRLLGGHDKPHSPSKDLKVNGTSAGNLQFKEDRCQHKCSHLHGHSARVEIEMASLKLNSKGMVVDFFDIKRTIGEWIERNLDHKMILWSKDPIAKLLKKAGEPVVLVKENPTAEMLARWIFREALRMKLPVSKVTLWENQDSCAVFKV